MNDKAPACLGSADTNHYYDGHHPHGKPLDPHASVPHLVGADGGPIARVAAVAVLNASGQILVGFNKKRAVWDVPQGVIEPGDLAHETALRELEEETGIVAQPDDLQIIATFAHRTPEFVFPWETTLYIASCADVSAAHNAEPHKCERLGWYAPIQLPVPQGLSLRVLLALLGR